MTPTAVFISGTGTNLQAIIDHWRSQKAAYDLRLVISNVAGVPGLEKAQKAGLKTQVISHKDFADKETFDRALDRALREEGIELVALAGFMRLLSPWFVRTWAGRLVNIHPSLLPAFTGLNTHQKAIDYGVRYSGCSVIFVDEGVDSGAIIEQAVVPVLADDDAKTLAARILAEEHRIFPLALDDVASGRVALLAGRVVRKPA